MRSNNHPFQQQGIHGFDGIGRYRVTLDKSKVNGITDKFDKKTFKVLQEIDGKIDYPVVNVDYLKMHNLSGTRVTVPGYEIKFSDFDKNYMIILRCRSCDEGSDISPTEFRNLKDTADSLRAYHSAEKLEVKAFLLYSLKKDNMPPHVNFAMQESGIRWYPEAAIDQLAKMIETVGPSLAFYDFLHAYCQIDMRFGADPLKFRCFMNNNFGRPTYTFVASAQDLLRVSYVFRARASSPGLQEAYQRAIKEKRLEEIAEYIIDYGQKGDLEVFPNNLVVNIEKKWSDFPTNAQGSDLVTISIPNEYAALAVIDGQHRLFSFCGVGRKKPDLAKNYRFVVTAYDSIDAGDQAEIFYTINDKQVGIPADLIAYIQSHLRDSSKGIAANILLEVDKKEYFSKRIKKGYEEERGAWLSLGTLSNALVESGLIDYPKPEGGLIQRYDKDETTPLDIVDRYVRFVSARKFRADWGNGKEGFSQTNQGLSILFILLRYVAKDFVKSKDDLGKLSDDVLTDYFSNLNSQDLDVQDLVGQDISDIRNRTDRKKVADALWELM